LHGPENLNKGRADLAQLGHGEGWYRREMFFLVNHLIQPLKSQHFSLPNLKYQLKNKYPPWPKTLQKDTIQLSHMSFTTSVT
jgi:hypothetical protein